MSMTLKVVLIGDSRVGKTTVMNRLLGEHFDKTFVMTKTGGMSQKFFAPKLCHISYIPW